MSEQEVAQEPEQQAVIWVMDSDICEMCGGLMNDWGFCDMCLYDGIDYDEDEWGDYDDPEWYPG